MRKGYAELISGVESMIRALVIAQGEIREYLDHLENAALSLNNIIDSEFMEEIESGKEPDVQGLYDYLREMFSKLSDDDPETNTFCCNIKHELTYTFGPMICTFSDYLNDLKNNAYRVDDTFSDNPFYEVTEIIDNTKE